MLSNSSICSEAVVFSHFINSYLSVDFEAGLLQRVLKVQNLKKIYGIKCFNNFSKKITLTKQRIRRRKNNLLLLTN